MREELLTQRRLAIICGLILLAILVAGLWPFGRPANGVAWIGGEPGLRFDGHGTALAAGPWISSAGHGAEACTVEFRLRVNRPGFGTILAVHSGADDRQFIVRQYGTGFVLETRRAQGNKESPDAVLVAGAFSNSTPVFIILTSAGKEVEVYVNGALTRTSHPFGLSARDLAGQLVLGTSPVSGNGWTGDVLGLALFQRHITSAEARAHYVHWSGGGWSEIAYDRPLALYAFDEHRGRVVRNRAGPGLNLYIPNRYLVVDQLLLQWPMQEFRMTWGYWRDFGINVLGFVPLGFCFFAYLRKSNFRAAGLIALVIGGSASFAIELLQSRLPTRSSGITDLITNTLGTFLGVILFRRAVSSRFLCCLSLPAPPSQSRTGAALR